MKHALIVAAILAVSLTACGKKEEAAPPAAPPATAEPAPAPEQAASAPAEAPAAQGEQKPQ